MGLGHPVWVGLLYMARDYIWHVMARDMRKAVDLEVLQKMRARKHVRNVRTGQTRE